jgi:hypothetical protein
MAFAAQCVLAPERQIVDSLLGRDKISALQATTKVDAANSLIGSGRFYTGLIEWVSSLPHESPNDSETALTVIEQELRLLKQDFESRPTASTQLAWGLAAAHGARVMLASKQVLKGIKLAGTAITTLQQYQQTPDSSEQGRAAASFAIGMFYIYSNAIPPEFQWASSLIAKTGTPEQGRSLIEMSIQNSTVLAPEAVRALLLETPWQTPLYCDYMKLSRQMVDSYPQNPDLSIARQALLLRCGYPEAALQENSRIVDEINQGIFRGYYDENYTTLLLHGRQRALADLGYVDKLEADENGQFADHFQQYALANALDVMGNRTRAKLLYNQLATGRNTPESIKINATARLRIPYSRRETIQAQRSLTMAICFDN